MKKLEIFFNVILVPLDGLLVIASALSAYYLRFQPIVTERYPVLYEIKLEDYFKMTLLISPFVVLIFALEGLYSMKTIHSRAKEIHKIFTASSIALLSLIIALFFFREFFSSRFIIILAWILIIISMSAVRFFIRILRVYLAQRMKVGVYRILLVGKNRISEEIRAYFEKFQKQFEVVKVVDNFTWKKLKKIKDKYGLDIIIQADPEMPRLKTNQLVRFSDIYKLDYKYIPNLFETHVSNVNIKQIAGFPIIELCKTSFDGWGRVAKRIFDIVFASLFILIFAPLFLLIALLVRLDSPGSIIYTDYRCGYKKKKFKFYKFRSLREDLCDGELGTEEGNKYLRKLERDQKKNTRKGSPLHKIKNDPRVTRVGRFIRKYSLDELPQFFNVLRGDMSIVGYRPHMSYEVDKFNYDQQRMFYVKPGITGLAQISGRSDLDFDEEVRLDIYYMERWSLLMDLAIIVKTPFVLFRRRRVA